MLVAVCGVLFAGVPLTVVHSHADATFGHAHDVSEHHHAVELEHQDDQDNEEFDSGTLHVHAPDVVSPGMAATLKITVLLQQTQSRYSLPVDTWVPDKPVKPLFRPPIS